MESAEIAKAQKETATDTALESKNERTHLKLSRGGVILSVLFMLSFVGLFCLMYTWDTNSVKKKIAICAEIVMALAVLGFIFFYYKPKIWEKFDLKTSKVKTLLSIIFFLGFVSVFAKYYLFSRKPRYVCLVLSLFSVYVLSYAFTCIVLNFIKHFKETSTKQEIYLFLIIVAEGVIIATIVFFFTEAFQYPTRPCDAVFSYDTGNFYRYNYFLNVHTGENDYRHILLTISQIPFSILPYMVSLIFPSVRGIYGLFISYSQIVALSWCIIKIIQMLNVKDGAVKIVLAETLMFCSTILFNMVTIEKYGFLMFWVVLTVALTIEGSDLRWVALLFSSGILTTNILLLPVVLFYNKKTVKEYVLDLVKFVVFSLLLLLLMGQINKIIFAKDFFKVAKNKQDVSIPFGYSVAQMSIIFFNLVFVPSRISPNGVWQAVAKFDATFYIGLLIFIICVVGFILNRKDKYARICFYWLMFIFILHGIVGWGMTNILNGGNESFLFSSIYAFAIYSLVYMFFRKIIKNKIASICVVSVIFATILVYNLYQFSEIVQVLTKLYPR